MILIRLWHCEKCGMVRETPDMPKRTCCGQQMTRGELQELILMKPKRKTKCKH